MMLTETGNPLLKHSVRSNLSLCLRSNFDVTELHSSIPEYYFNSLKNWFQLKQQSSDINETNTIGSNYIWYNKNIRINSQCIFNKRLFSIGMWLTSGLFYNGDLVPFHTWQARGARESDRLVWLAITKIVN